MSVTTHKLRVAEARRIKHPVFPTVEKHTFLVQAKDVPSGIRTDANARDAEGLNRRVYREVHESLMGRDAMAGSFDLMNKGIVCLADGVRRIDDTNYEITIRDGQGIVDGGHTYKIICDAQNEGVIPDEQFVEIQIRTGVDDRLITDISRGLNTGMQVKDHSIANLAGKFDWIKDELRAESYFSRIAWNESDKGDYDVRDIICVLEAMNVIDFPNESSVHPVAAYEKWSVPTKKFADDFDAHENVVNTKYHKLRGVLRDALRLFDTIRHDFRDVYNSSDLGNAGALDIMEEARGKSKAFDFPFAGLGPSQYRLTKGALYPIFGAFRNALALEADGSVRWIGGFDAVLKLWENVAPELAKQTKQAIKDYGHKPDVIGKNRGHWTNMHQTVELHILRQRMKESGGRAAVLEP